MWEFSCRESTDLKNCPKEEIDVSGMLQKIVRDVRDVRDLEDSRTC